MKLEIKTLIHTLSGIMKKYLVTETLELKVLEKLKYSLEEWFCKLVVSPFGFPGTHTSSYWTNSFRTRLGSLNSNLATGKAMVLLNSSYLN